MLLQKHFVILHLLVEFAEVISPSYSKKRSKQRIDRLNNKVTITSGFSLGWNGRITKFFAKLSTMVWLLFFLLFKCKKGELVIVYHHVHYVPWLLIAMFFKRLRFILEVEEIYSALEMKSGLSWRSILEKSIIHNAYRFIFASSQLEKKCNSAMRKPFVVATGSYIVPNHLGEKIKDDKIHAVYAGLIEKDKVAFRSANIAKYLDAKYMIHIIGYGKDSDIDALNKMIDEINKTSDCKVRFDGLKRGDDYIRYLQSCHIGLCPLSTNIEYQKACFPSKITSYLSNGLFVVTTTNEVLKTSSYKDYLYFVKDNTPKEFAQAIKGISLNLKPNPCDCIIKEDKRMLQEFPNLFGCNEK